MMNTHMLNAPGELFLGSDIATAFEQGPRRFRTSRNAIRFAMEQAAPVSLRGALLKIGTHSFGPEQIRSWHRELAEAPEGASARFRARR